MRVIYLITFAMLGAAFAGQDLPESAEAGEPVEETAAPEAEPEPPPPEPWSPDGGAPPPEEAPEPEPWVPDEEADPDGEAHPGAEAPPAPAPNPPPPERGSEYDEALPPDDLLWT